MIAGMVLASVSTGFLSLMVSVLFGAPALLLAAVYALVGGATMVLLALAGAVLVRRDP